MKIAIAGGTGTVGRHVVAVARERGHDVVVLTRSNGVNLMTGAGLAPSLDGVEVVVDVSSTLTQSAKKSREFYETATTNLLAAEKRAAVPHHVALSIVGSDKAPFGYYAGKEVQEQLVTAGPIPWTIVRATQFHEFAQQLFSQMRFGPVTVVPKMVSQPVAARDVGEYLISLAESDPAGRPADLAGPEVLQMVDMVKAYAAAVGKPGPTLEVSLPGGFGRAMRDGTLLPTPGARLGRTTFQQWVSALDPIS
ncbi:SDR family oxidoreductase [Microbacterium sp. EST19A]|uniref:SDR family oxidoreductase n=1 Tax=Microbacterium sp. EST19A TaxID=2862681 RepID=UPI001CC07B61|nr:NmrA family NAD(P)-binding protein [Microbacterium sp. EST19A]